jgi:exodeoxyribonuclease VII large subunit
MNKPECYTVSRITREIRTRLENNYPDIIIEGEISNFRPSSTGHYYFSLKDSDSIISAAMFKNRHSSLNFKLADGILVKARGSISVYPKRGTYQLICEKISKSGEGELLAKIEELKRKLAREGLFEPSGKKALPLFPSRIAVITSPTGAAVRDILQVLKRRNSGINVIILPAPVQGAEAGFKIAEMIKIANIHKMGDVIITGRGGGSLEDLLPFYEETVVRAIAESEIPVISAVGHEIDISLSDLAADVRAPTPSAAAELVSARRDELLHSVVKIRSSLIDSLKQRIEKNKLLLEHFKPEYMEKHFRYILQNLLVRYDDAKEKLLSYTKDKITKLRHKLELLNNTVISHSPVEILKRGYSIVKDKKSGKIIKTSNSISIGSEIDIRLYKGNLTAEIKKKGEQNEII